MSSTSLPRHRTGQPELDAKLVELLDAAGATDNRDQLFEILATVVLLAEDHPDRLDPARRPALRPGARPGCGPVRTGLVDRHRRGPGHHGCRPRGSRPRAGL